MGLGAATRSTCPVLRLQLRSLSLVLHKSSGEKCLSQSCNVGSFFLKKVQIKRGLSPGSYLGHCVLPGPSKGSLLVTPMGRVIWPMSPPCHACCPARLLKASRLTHTHGTTGCHSLHLPFLSLPLCIYTGVREYLPMTSSSSSA
jgi:hypothetical protein